MKIKTSITLSEEVLLEIDKLSGETRNRSAFIEIAIRDFLKKNMTHMQQMHDRLYEGLKANCGNTQFSGHLEKRLPNTLSISFEGLEANRILDAIEPEVAASA